MAKERHSRFLPLPEADEIRLAFDYCDKTGVLRWKEAPVRDGFSRTDKARNTQIAGKVTGCIMANGYLRVLWKGRHFVAHRLIWKWFYGEEPTEIDHVNGKRGDNRIANLRLASASQNSANQRTRSDNKTGVKGIYRKGKRWAAQVRKNGKAYHCGTFDTPSEAIAAYRKKAAELHAEFHRPT